MCLAGACSSGWPQTIIQVRDRLAEPYSAKNQSGSHTSILPWALCGPYTGVKVPYTGAPSVTGLPLIAWNSPEDTLAPGYLCAGPLPT